MSKIDFKKLSHYSYYFLVGGILLAEALVLVFLMPPQITKLINNWQTLLQTTHEVIVLKNISVALTTQDKASLQPYLNRAQFALPDEKKAAGLITGLTKFASTYGVAVQTFDFSPGLVSTSSASTGFLKTNTTGEVVVPGGAKAIPATLTVTADPSSLKIFLDALNNASQLIGITLVGYSSSDKNSNVANISVLIYYQPVSGNTIDWQNIRTLTADDISFLGTLPNEDKFILK